jgi:hypothetical protein
LLHDAVSVIAEPVNGDELLAEIVHAGGLVGGACQLTVAVACGPVPVALLATTVYVFAPGTVSAAVHFAPLAVHPVHRYPVGLAEQFAVRVIVSMPASGALLLDVMEQFETGPVCQVTVAWAGELLPTALLATTVNVFGPAVDDDAEHDDVLLEQPVHAYVVGLPLHEAASTTEPLIVGVGLLGYSEHTGTVGEPVPLPFQSASKPTRAPTPAPFAACRA